ncbi:hypothetical protein JOL79_01940 [Microbispora sp. RL4-1S]|uniref:SPOR domain-containing protein n=2 Tax=Microbispora oryzae TaxID=2806554 RepID=A0A940WJZ9_9ACTN|nr:hypothetical protein [Microbispora oryzae]MBP2702561.1 hypothetical protein [Microbispora oryzae]
MMSVSDQWWFCLKHMRVEPEKGCPNKDRLGPYESESAAADALKTASERNKAWAEKDREWDE